MKPKLINNCKNTYMPDPIKVTDKILQKIPSKFLQGLDEIIFHDLSNDPVIKYIVGNKDKSNSKINIYMKGFATNGKYSLLHYNLLLLTTITDHIVMYLQPISDDPDINAVIRHRYNQKWVYMGPIASIMMAPLNFLSFLYKKVIFFQSWMNKFIRNLSTKFRKDT